MLSRGPSPPPLAARPPPPVTSKPSSPAPRQAGDQSAEGAGFGGAGRGGGRGLRERREGPRKRQRWEGRKGASGLPSTSRLRAQDPTSRVSASRRLYSLVSDL